MCFLHAKGYMSILYVGYMKFPTNQFVRNFYSKTTNCVNVPPQTFKKCQCSPNDKNTLHKIIQKNKITKSYTKIKNKTGFFFVSFFF
jgi:hypothetical protein